MIVESRLDSQTNAMFARSVASRIARGVFRGTPAQLRALERATKKHLQLDTRHVDTKALEVYQELRKTHVLGDKLLSPLEVARVLKAEASVSGLHPNDLKNLKRLKMLTDNINNVAGVCTATGLSVGAGTWTLHHWNTSFPMSDLPADFFW